MIANPYPHAGRTFTYEPGPFQKWAASPVGAALWAFLTQAHIVYAMEKAVWLDRAPVAAISPELLFAFGDGDSVKSPRASIESGLAGRFGSPIDFDHLKKMIGHMIRQILETLGCGLRTKNSPAGDPLGVFTSSARYTYRVPEGAGRGVGISSNTK
jgi:hypothetical protein